MLALLPFALLPQWASYAQTNAPAPGAHSHRYLLIVETSRAMHRRSEGIVQSVQDLLGSKMGGQLIKGDTIGLWTYNEELSAGKLSVQQWSEDTQQAVTARIVGFLKAQKYEKQAKIDKVLPPLGHLIKNSRVITVCLISDGTEEIHGTAFDDKINNVFKLWRSQQQDLRMPFVTVLRGVRGDLTDCVVNPAPWKVELPPLPPEPQVAKASPKTVTPPKPAPLPPLIISGKKHDSPAVTSSAETSAPAQSVTALASNNDAARQQVANLVSAPAPAVGTQAAPVSQLQAVTTPPSTATPTAAQAEQPPPVDSKAQMPQGPSEPQPLSDAHNIAGAASGSALVTKSSQDPSSVVKDQHPEVSSTVNTNALPAQVAAVSPRGPGSTSTLLALAALFGIVLILGLIWFWRSRPRPAQPESLITQSFDRNRK